MSLYAAPFYVGLSCLLSLSYSCIECVKEKGNFDIATCSIFSTWVIITLIVASVIAGVAGEMMIGMTNYMHLLIALVLACVTLSISSSIIHWS
jgi:hypothetical protein